MSRIFTPVLGRIFVASMWYETSGMSKREKLYAKTRELVSGDRAEIMIEDGDTRYFDKCLNRLNN